MDRNLEGEVDGRVLGFLPPHTYWHGRIFHLETTQIDDVIQQLGVCAHCALGEFHWGPCWKVLFVAVVVVG